MSTKDNGLGKDYNLDKTVNTFTLVAVTVIDLLMFFGYISEYVRVQSRHLYYISVVVVLLITLILNYAVYFRKKDSKIFKNVSLTGYIIVYALCVLGASNDLIFCIAFPILVVYILYFDFSVILQGAIAFAAVNIVDLIRIVGFAKHLHSGAAIDSTSLLIQGACIIFYVVVICNCTKISNRNQAMQIDSINAEKEHAARLLEDVLQLAVKVKENSREASNFIQELGRDVDITTGAMEEIADGNNNNAQNIERQTVMTGNIQSMIEDTKRMSDEMLELSKQSNQAVEDGRISVRNLAENSHKTQEANKQVETSVRNFIQNVNEVQEIVSQIFSISDQTNLLALNASIESARAGEAGRGFSVVAEEIRKLAEETRVLTEKIEGIVTVLQNNADQAIRTVNNVLETAATEHSLIDNTNSRFNEIGSSMDGLNTNVRQIYQRIEEIIESNNAIVDSISQISAVSEEVAASTQQTVEKSLETREKAANAEHLMENLVETVSAIDKYLEN